jgi:predicted ABC-type ATPase
MAARKAGQARPPHNTPPTDVAPLWFHLLAGPNGAGKSTLYRALVREGILGPPLEFVNADLHEASHLQHIADPQARSEAARQWADARRAELLASRIPFASETVFSHPSKLRLIQDAQQLGFTVALHIVALDDPARLPARVARRVLEGGHPVPAERILARYPRTLHHLAQAVRTADVSYLYDGEDIDRGGPQLVALRTPAGTTLLQDPPPVWAARMLAG